MRGILTYHSIDPSGSAISVDAATFAAHVEWLATPPTRVVPLGDVLRNTGDDPVVALTFDDGFANFAAEAWPRLRDHGLPATLFVVASHAGGTNAWGGGPGGRAARGIPTLPLLDWHAIGNLAEEGVDIGAHTRSHPDLRTVDAARLADEVEGGAADIAARTGCRPAGFAYPYGAVDARARREVARVYARACTTELRPLRTSEDAHRLPRLDAFYFRRPEQLAAWGTARFRARLTLRRAMRAARASVTGRPA